MNNLNEAITGLMPLEGCVVERVVARHNPTGKAYAILVLKKDGHVYELHLRDSQGNGIPPLVSVLR